MRHAEIEAAAQPGDRSLAIRLVDIPSPLPDNGDFAGRGAEWPPLH
jgi:hypothetical protein